MKLLLISLFIAVSVQIQQKQQKIVLPRWDYYLTSKEKSRYAFFKFDAKRDDYIFNKNFRPASLSNNEILSIEKMIIKKAVEFNQHAKHSKVDFGLINKPEKYFKQFIAVVNSKGEKEVWVNCCCSVIHNYWKTHIQTTEDGGSCYFQLKINLAKNMVYDFSVNGVA